MREHTCTETLYTHTHADRHTHTQFAAVLLLFFAHPLQDNNEVSNGQEIQKRRREAERLKNVNRESKKKT